MSKIKSFYKAHPIIAWLCTMALTILIVLWGIMLFLNRWTRHGDDAIVPNIKGMTYSEAARELERNDLSIEISDSVYDTSVSPGTIMECWPKDKSVVKRGRKVYVTITAFSPKHVTITMPVTGVSLRQATSYFKAIGITAIQIKEVPSQYPDLVENAYAKGRPIGVGSVIEVNSPITLEVGYIEEATDTLEAVIDSIYGADHL